VRIGIRSLVAIVLSCSFVAAPSAAQEAVGQPEQSSYRINAGDELEIHVWGEERLQRAVKVLPDGSIAFPLVGQVMARGLLPQDLERAISARLEGQYRGEVPQVTVSVISPAGLQFSVLGRVRAPGSFTPGRYVNVLEALSMAGGPNEFANLDSVVIIRKMGDDLQVYRLQIGAVVKGNVTSRDSSALSNIIRIESGDTVIVP
jgi:polysaccharide biosynthesis/export protein